MNNIKVLSSANSERETSYFGLACLLRLKIRCPSVPHAANSREHNPKNKWWFTSYQTDHGVKLGVFDLFEFNGAHYLLSVDYYTKWIEIAKLSILNSNNVICHLKSQFVKYGIPDELISDNGHQYSILAFKEFSNNYGFVHTSSSPKYPQANGEAERAVQTIESLLKKAQDPFKALLNYSNTPLEGKAYRLHNCL